MDKILHLEQDKIPRLLMRYSIPAIVGMGIQALYNIAARVFIGYSSVGIDGISALTASFPLLLIFIAFGMLFGIGGSAAFSIALGEKNNIKAEKIIAGTLFLLTVTTLFLTIITQIFAPKILSLFGASEKILQLSLDYTRIVIAGSVINSSAYAMNNFVRAQGKAKTAMLSMVAGGVLNIILDYIFIFIFKWGIKGVAVATVISQTVTGIIVFLYLFGKKSYIKIKIKNLIPAFEIVKVIISIGLAQFSIQLLTSLTNALLNNQLQKYGGDVALSLMGMIFSFMQIIFMPILGINQGSMPIMGYNYGAKKFERVIHTVYVAIAAATVIMTTGFIITRLFPAQILLAFGKQSNEILDKGVVAIKIFFSMSCLVGFQIAASGMFQAIGKPALSIIMTISRQLIFLIPLAYILPIFFQLNGIWLSIAASDLLATIVTAFFFFREIGILRKKIST
ncbi:MAG: MATE family efflux transporter [Spirochaetaceae bacterium]|nr:MATE family efflux transporter [Spirochaetaceae bacterium]